MITYGFFNSVNNDRLYNAETFNNYFEGLISANGIFENVRGSFVTSAASSGLAVNVATGKALVNTCWVVNDAIETITLDTAHNLLARYDKIGLLWDETNRNVTLRKVTGTPTSSPLKAAPVRTATQYEIVLAYVYVGPNATSITAANITDCRYDTNLCGVITGLIDQVDTTTLYNQYATQFAEIRSQLETWEAQQQAQMTAWETQQKAQFETWFNALTQQLNVNTYIDQRSSDYSSLVDGTTTTFDAPFSDYNIESDIVDVYLNNIVLLQGIDYTINGSKLVLKAPPRAGNVLSCRMMRSKIGYEQTSGVVK